MSGTHGLGRAWSGRAIAVAISLAMLMLSTAARAEPSAAGKAKAREAYLAGARHYNLDEFQEALASFQLAYRAYDDPSLLFNIGQCERMLGLKQKALHSYRAYLREQPDAPNRAEVGQLIASLETALREEQSSRGMPPAGVLPTPSKVEARTSETTSPTPPPPSLAVVPATAPSPAATSDAIVAAPDARPRHTPIYKRWWLWTAVGVVAAGAAAGVAIAVTRPAPVSYPAATTTNGSVQF